MPQLTTQVVDQRNRPLGNVSVAVADRAGAPVALWDDPDPAVAVAVANPFVVDDFGRFYDPTTEKGVYAVETTLVLTGSKSGYIVFEEEIEHIRAGATREVARGARISTAPDFTVTAAQSPKALPDTLIDITFGDRPIALRFTASGAAVPAANALTIGIHDNDANVYVPLSVGNALNGGYVNQWGRPDDEPIDPPEPGETRQFEVWAINTGAGTSTIVCTAAGGIDRGYELVAVQL